MTSLTNLRLASALLTFLLVLVWYGCASEAEPWAIIPGKHESYRFKTLRLICQAANKGYYFQLAPGTPMDREWDDPGQGTLLTYWGILKRKMGWGELNPYADVYRVELFVFLLTFGLIFGSPLFNLPRWYWWIVPVFTAWALIPMYPLGDYGLNKLNGLFYLSGSARWAKAPAAFWLSTVSIQFFEWWRQGTLFRFPKGRALRLFFYGLVLGLFFSIRKELFFTSYLALGISLFLLARATAEGRWKKWGALILMAALLTSGHLAIKGFIRGTWWVRDRIYPMRQVHRMYGHPFWHTLCTGLGYIKNPEGLGWDDWTIWQLLRADPENKRRGLQYATRTHEEAARRLFFNTLAKDPGLVWRNLGRKIHVVWMDHSWFLAAGVGASFLVIAFSRTYRLLGWIFLVNIFAGSAALLVVNPWLHYGLDFITYFRMATLAAIALAVHQKFIVRTQ